MRQNQFFHFDTEKGYGYVLLSKDRVNGHAHPHFTVSTIKECPGDVMLTMFGPSRPEEVQPRLSLRIARHGIGEVHVGDQRSFRTWVQELYALIEVLSASGTSPIPRSILEDNERKINMLRRDCDDLDHMICKLLFAMNETSPEALKDLQLKVPDIVQDAVEYVGKNTLSEVIDHGEILHNGETDDE